jgi:DNA-binding NtrC family response regulator
LIVVTALTDRSLRTALGYMLRDAGADVFHAQGPEAALAAVLDRRPDVLLAADDILGGPLALVDGVKSDAKAFRTTAVRKALASLLTPS